MATIHIRDDVNKDISFVHIINSLVSYKLMSLEEAVALYKRFKAMNDIVLEVPGQAADKLRMELTELHCIHE